jgi:hypothetical membrane protein
MGPVTSNRLRWGALAWLLTLQFFVVETVAQLRQDLPYSRVDDLISDLGAADSPAASLMNASFVAQAALVLAGTLALRPLFSGLGGRLATVLLGVTSAGLLLVGVFPQDASGALHTVGASLYLGGSALGLIALAYAVRPRSEALGTTLAVLGLLGAAASVFFVMAVTAFLGEGGTERAAAYVLPVGLAVAGAGLWRGGAGPGVESDAARVRREEREQARADRAERTRARDEALEAASRDRDVPAEMDEPEDHWAAPARRDD